MIIGKTGWLKMMAAPPLAATAALSTEHQSPAAFIARFENLPTAGAVADAGNSISLSSADHFCRSAGRSHVSDRLRPSGRRLRAAAEPEPVRVAAEVATKRVCGRIMFIGLSGGGATLQALVAKREW